MRELWPNRTMLYGGVSPTRVDAIDRIDELVDVYAVNGVKFYPHDLIDGRISALDLGDVDKIFPVLQRVQDRGIKVIGVHKAMPLGRGPIGPLKMDDIQHAAHAFPDLTFEIVHGGVAFVEETSVLMQSYANVVVNLEVTSGFAKVAPRRFAEAMATFLSVPFGADRIIWGTGCDLAHPRPLIEAFWNFEMPEDLLEGWGVPPLTQEAKKKILGANFLRIHGIDPDDVRKRVAGDEFDTDELLEPWSGQIEPVPMAAV